MWDDVLEIVRRRFPEAVGKGVVPCTGHTAIKRGRVNARRWKPPLGLGLGDLRNRFWVLWDSILV